MTITKELHQKTPNGPKDLSQTVEDGPKQPLKPTYPAHLIKDSYRRFNSSFYQRHQWLEYSEVADAVYCFHCRHYPEDSHQEVTFTEVGYRQWNRCYGKESSLKKHERSEMHQKAIEHSNAQMILRKTGQSRQTVLNMLGDKHRKVAVENRHYLKTVCEVLLLTATQKIAQRESGSVFRDADFDIENLSYGSNCGNFLGILTLVAKHDPIVAKKIKHGPKNAKYTHHSIQNALFDVMADMVRKEIRDEISQATYFALLVDESKDVSKKEQISFVLRYTLNGMIHEEFVGMKSATHGLDAESLSASILEFMAAFGMNMNNCVGQGYDGASVMKGHVSGVNVLVQREAPLANYVHCFNHRLNLVVVDVLKNIKKAADFFVILQKLYVFISGSAVQMKWIQLQKDMNLKPLQMKKLSDTRWSCQYEMCSTVYKRLGVVIKLLQQIDSHDKDRDRAFEARCLLGLLNEDFCLLLVAVKEILMNCKAASDFLQNSENSLADAVDIVENMIEGIASLRKESCYAELKSKAEELCEENEIQARAPKRASRVPERFENEIIDSTIGMRAPPTDSFRTAIFYPLIDRALSELNRRFSAENKEIMKGISALTPKSSLFLQWEVLQPFANMYKCNLGDLELEVLNMKRMLTRRPTEEKPKGRLEFSSLTERLRDAFFELNRLLTIACVIPVSTASCERSFSTLRVVKNYLRNRMTDARLNSLMLLGIQSKRANSLNLDTVIDNFKCKFPNCRISLV